MKGERQGTSDNMVRQEQADPRVLSVRNKRKENGARHPNSLGAWGVPQRTTGMLSSAKTFTYF